MRAPLAAALAVALGACLLPDARPPADVCEAATRMFQTCGATVPALEREPCTGVARLVSRCVTEHVKDCDELVTLPRRLDECLDDAGTFLLDPAEELPFPYEGLGDGGARADAGAAADAGSWQGMDAVETVKTAEERRYATPTLPAGIYLFTLTGSGNADLFVRKALPPAVDAYDCRPADATSNESCTVTLFEPGVIHLLVRGVAASSSYSLRGRP